MSMDAEDVDDEEMLTGEDLAGLYEISGKVAASGKALDRLAAVRVKLKHALEQKLVGVLMPLDRPAPPKALPALLEKPAESEAVTALRERQRAFVKPASMPESMPEDLAVAGELATSSPQE